MFQIANIILCILFIIAIERALRKPETDQVQLFALGAGFAIATLLPVFL